MAKTYKILVNDGKGTDIQPVRVMQGGEPVRVLAKRGWRFELQDDLKGKSLAPDQVRIKRVGKNLTLMFDGSQRADVVIEDYYAENTDKDKDNGSPKLVGTAENGGMYEYVPQDPAVSSMPAELKDGNTPVIVSLGGGPLGDDFVLSALPLVAAAGGVSGWLVAGGVAAAAAAGGGGGGGSGAAVVVVPAKATGSLTHDATNDTGVSDKDSITNNKTPVLTINAEHGAKVVVTVNGKEYTATETSTAGVYTVPVTDELKDGTYTPTIKVTNSAGSTTSDGTPFTVDLSTFTDPYPTDPFNPPVINKSGLRVTIDTDANNDGLISNSELPSSKLVTATVALTKDAVAGDVLTVAATGNTTRNITLNQANIDAHKYVLTDLIAPTDGNTITVSASIKDAAGNASPTPDAKDVAKLDVSAPNEGVAPVVKIATDGANGGVADGWLNNIEIEAGNTAFKSADAKVTITASFDKNKVTVGDTVVFKVGASTQEVLLDTQAKVDIGIVSIQVDAPQKGQAITATALIKDSVSNSTLESAAVTATRNSLDAVEDTASISAANTTISGNVVNNDLDPQYLADHKNQNTSSDNLEVAVDAVKKGTSAGFAVADQLFKNGGTVQGNYGTLKLKSDGSYDYVLNNDAKTHALAAGETAQELFAYEVVDDAGNVSMAKLTVTITGVNDMAILTVKQTIYKLGDSQSDSGLWKSILSITDADTGEGYLNGINHDVAGSYQTSKINLHYGDLNLTQVGGETTSPIYDLQYFKNNLGQTSSTDTARHDLYVLNSADGTATETLDFEIDPTGTIQSHEYHTSSTVGLKIASASPTTFDTLLLDVSGNTFDFTGLAATTNIKSIEKVDISGSGNNTIKLSLDSLTQADAVNNVHQLFIDGNAGDQVQLVNGNQAVKADTTSVPGYDRYVVDSTHELLIQHAITISFIS